MQTKQAVIDPSLRILLNDSHRSTADFAVEVLIQKPELTAPIIYIALNNTYPWSMRAANIVEKTFQKNPEQINPFFDEIANYILHPKNESTMRCLLRIFTTKEAYQKNQYKEILLQIALERVCNSQLSIAVRNYCIDIIYLLLPDFKDIKEEFHSILSMMAETEENALRYKAKKIHNFFLNKML